MKRNYISQGSEWTFELIDKYDQVIGDIADSYGLDTYPNQIELIRSEQMMDAYASVGMPLGYNHWSYGKQFLNVEQNYKRGEMGLAYEIVINSNPCIAYLMEENTMTKNLMPPNFLPDMFPEGYQPDPEDPVDGEDPAEARAKSRTVKALLTAGANLEAPTDSGDTPLAMAALLGRGGSGRLLLSAGARVNPPNKIGETPLMQAAANGHLEMVRLLLQKGAEIGALDDEGNTARVIADLSGQDAVEDYLRRRETLSPVPSGA